MSGTANTDFDAPMEEAGEHPASIRGSYNTIKRTPQSSLRYSTRLMLSFALTAVMTAAILVAVLSFVWEGQFQSYTRQNMQRVATSTAETLSSHYAEVGEWTPEVIANVTAASALSDDIGVQLVDAEGIILYDDTWAITTRTLGKSARCCSDAFAGRFASSGQSVSTRDSSQRFSTSPVSNPTMAFRSGVFVQNSSLRLRDSSRTAAWLASTISFCAAMALRATSNAAATPRSARCSAASALPLRATAPPHGATPRRSSARPAAGACRCCPPPRTTRPAA